MSLPVQCRRSHVLGIVSLAAVLLVPSPVLTQQDNVAARSAYAGAVSAHANGENRVCVARAREAVRLLGETNVRIQPLLVRCVAQLGDWAQVGQEVGTYFALPNADASLAEYAEMVALLERARVQVATQRESRERAEREARNREAQRRQEIAQAAAQEQARRESIERERRQAEAYARQSALDARMAQERSLRESYASLSRAGSSELSLGAINGGLFLGLGAGAVALGTYFVVRGERYDDDEPGDEAFWGGTCSAESVTCSWSPSMLVSLPFLTVGSVLAFSALLNLFKFGRIRRSRLSRLREVEEEAAKRGLELSLDVNGISLRF